MGACGMVLAGCDTLSSINPFDKSEKYKPEIVATAPAEQIYNDGLARIQNRDFDGAAKKFASLDRQYPFSEWSRPNSRKRHTWPAPTAPSLRSKLSRRNRHEGPAAGARLGNRLRSSRPALDREPLPDLG